MKQISVIINCTNEDFEELEFDLRMFLDQNCSKWSMTSDDIFLEEETVSEVDEKKDANENIEFSWGVKIKN